MEPGTSEPAGKTPAGPGAPPKTDPGKAPLGAPRPRPRPVQPAPAPAKTGSKNARKYIMYGLIVSTVVLSGLIAWRLIVKFTTPERVVRNVGEEWRDAMTQAQSAQKEIFALESKVWLKSEKLTEEDFKTIKAGLARLQDSHDKMHDLLRLLRDKGREDSQDMIDITRRWAEVKLWIYDASELTAEGVQPPNYAGVNIPLFLETGSAEKTIEELKDFHFKKEEIRQRDAAGLEAARKQLRDIAERLSGAMERLNQLDQAIVTGLALPDADRARSLKDIEYLRDKMSVINQAIIQVRGLRSEFRE
jgi:hypothetical protein